MHCLHQYLMACIVTLKLEGHIHQLNLFLAVQDSSIGDLVSHSVTHLLISASSELLREF